MEEWSMNRGSIAALIGGTSIVFAGQGRSQIALEPIGRYETGQYAVGAAEIAAYDARSRRVFVTNASLGTVDVISIADPASPALLFSIDLSRYGSGANSVAAARGIIAVAVEAHVKTDPGLVLLFAAAGDGTPINQVAVGPQPDMLTFTPDGRTLLVANEGEPSDDYTVDPEGSISIIDLPRNVVGLTRKIKPRHATFEAFNGREDELRGQGVRIYGPGASASQDLEPEYIAVSDDGTTAWVTLQEANSIAILDIATATVSAIAPLGLKDHSLGRPVVTLHEFIDLPVLGTTAAGQDILLGGFSGLWFDGLDPLTGNWKFITHPDRGPNAEPQDVDGDGVNERPFALPDFQLEFVHFDYNPATGEVSITDRIGLTDGAGNPLTGLPNIIGQSNGLAYTDEEPCDVFGGSLPLDPIGGDIEGVVRDDNGDLWVCDEYRPAIYRFDSSGTMLARYVPDGSNDYGVVTGIEALPAVYAQRRANRGFEAIAYHSGRIYAFVQSPLDVPDTANDSNSRNSMVTRILEFDVATETTVAQYAYIIDGGGSDKIGDAVAIRPGEFLVIERDDLTGPDARKHVYHVALQDATNLSTLPEEIVGPDGWLEGATLQELIDAGIDPVTKSLYFDPIAAGYDFVDKIEGLAMIQPGVIALLNDNDFGLAGGLDTDSGVLTFRDTAPAVLAVISFDGNGLDASDRDDGLNIVPRPVFGMYQPDAIAAFEVDGVHYLATVNEGDTRDWDGYSEEARIKDLGLDPVAYPTAEWLQADEQIGRLKTTTAHGDLDGDGDVDQIHTFGARSLSIWSESGELVWDSGDLLEQITAAALPDEFNSDHEENGSFDSRSDDKGPEPEAITVADIDNRTYVFVGLERIGGVMVYDVTDPVSPAFVQYVNTRDFQGDPELGTAGDLGPEGIVFVPANRSPIGEPMLIVTHEVSGSTAFFRVVVE
jgi:hypothetical protein